MSPERTSRASRSRPVLSRLEIVRAGVNKMFTRRSSVEKARITTQTEGRKTRSTPRLVLGLQNFSSIRLRGIPYLNRTATSTPIPDSPISAYSPSTLLSSRPITPNAYRQQIQPPTVSTLPLNIRHNSARRFIGVDPAGVHLAELAGAGRTRRKHKSKKKKRGCGPKAKHKKVRAKILACIISGLFLVLILTIYLALALTDRNESQEFHVLLILIILVTTIFFCHALIRLCMMMIRPSLGDEDLEQQNLPVMVGPGGYANPNIPIRVTLARDEEAAGIVSEATKLPPPAYGLWRESVRINPNRVFWQRNEGALQRQISWDARPTTANRPPSYISDNGIDYVVEAAPRSIAPATDVPLPIHPPERGRVWPTMWS